MTYMSNTGYCNGCASYSIANCVSGSYSASDSNISTLEAAVQPANDSFIPSTPLEVSNNSYGVVGYSTGYNLPSRTEYFTPAPFLKSDRPDSPFIGKADDIKHYIQEAFEAVTGKQLPYDMVISIVPEQSLRKKHTELGGTWNPGIQGFTLNRNGNGHNIIIVKENFLDEMMITIGHEIGHALSHTLSSNLAEEAKAFAFEMAWIKAIKDNNIAGLGESVNLYPMPAENGLHNVAFSFVVDKMDSMDALDLFEGLKTCEVEVDVRN